MSHHSMATTWWFYRSKRIRIGPIHHRATQGDAIMINVRTAAPKNPINNVSCTNFNRGMTLML